MSDRFLHQLAVDRRATLQRSGGHRPAGSLRRAVGSGLVRLGLRLRNDGRIPPLVSQPGTDAGQTPAAGPPAAATSRTGEG